MPSGSSKWASGKRSVTLRPPAALRTEEGSHGPQGPASMRDAWRGSRGKSRECRGHSDTAQGGDQMGRCNKLMLAVLVPGLITLCACQDLDATRGAYSSPVFAGQRSLAFWRDLERPLPPRRT